MTTRPHEQIAAVLSKDYPLYTMDILTRIGWDKTPIDIVRLNATLWEMIQERTILWHEHGGVVLR